MKLATIALLSLLTTGCAAQTYYACRSGGGSREACAFAPGTPRGDVLYPAQIKDGDTRGAP